MGEIDQCFNGHLLSSHILSKTLFRQYLAILEGFASAENDALSRVPSPSNPRTESNCTRELILGFDFVFGISFTSIHVSGCSGKENIFLGLVYIF